jgi:hypothetical protein
MVHVHGIARAAAREHVAAAGARPVAHGELVAAVRDADPEGTRAASLVREHWSVLERISAEATVLPVRFGTAMAGDEAVVDELLAPAHDDLLARLQELDGRLQLTVRGRYHEDALLRGVVAGSPAVARLRERVQAMPAEAGYFERIRLGELVAGEVERARERDTAAVLERLQPLAVAAIPEAPTEPDMAVNAAFLVERSEVDRFRAAVERLGQELRERMDLSCLGPLPAYSFAGSEAAWA